MKLIENCHDLKKIRSELSGRVGFVPTLGNLHLGHLSLIKASLDENDYTIVSIFVNPLQFGAGEDFETYPRTLEQDCDKIKSLSDKIIVFAPRSPSEIYPQEFSLKVREEELSIGLCGQHRPGHFDGVTTVVYLLLALTRPTALYMGQKDYQQGKVIERMINNLHIPVEFHLKPIVRDDDGLALSSRNQYLSLADRKEALHLPKILDLINSLPSLKEMNELKNKELQNSGWDYLEILDADNLKDVTDRTRKILIAGAYRINQTRLIDNRVKDLHA